ncbi:MAG: hypothetical protein ABEJ34_02480 [Haloferacaceae archaeon]
MKAAGSGTLGALVASGWGATQSVDPVTQVDNPLKPTPTATGSGCTATSTPTTRSTGRSVTPTAPSRAR